MLDLFASINLLARRKRRLTNRSCSKTFLVVFHFVNRRPIHPTYRLYLYHHPTVRSLVRNSYLIYFRPLTNYFFSFFNQFFNLFVTTNINGSNLVKHCIDTSIVLCIGICFFATIFVSICFRFLLSSHFQLWSLLLPLSCGSRNKRCTVLGHKRGRKEL